MEALGVRFYVHGNVVPDERIPLELPALDEHGKPLFSLRGIQPFHDFFEGPDWWNIDNYKLYLGQMAKMRLNFIGLHNYPSPGGEPTVWIGPAEDVAPDGSVRRSYPASYVTTARPGWGNVPIKTSDYVGGASMIFENDAFGPDVMAGRSPAPPRRPAATRSSTEQAECFTMHLPMPTTWGSKRAWERKCR